MPRRSGRPPPTWVGALGDGRLREDITAPVRLVHAPNVLTGPRGAAGAHPGSNGREDEVRSRRVRCRADAAPVDTPWKGRRPGPGTGGVGVSGTDTGLECPADICP
ncbi:hypothetical protein GCM10010145_02460 [Streptomyces ruber]|uniref:Uncharacterized protein n=2 Tax=Streptomyces TaxID=1883 RepID=A0A918EQF8_9ACTN|nr:hypothetical protein GCM10010145_02460 [Streptomyces ruber]